MSTLFGFPNTAYAKTFTSAKNSLDAAALSVEARGGAPLRLSRSDPRHFTDEGMIGPLGAEKPPTFEDAMLKALDGVNSLQVDSTNAIETMMVNPKAIDAHDVTIAMAKASMSLNITRTILDRVVRVWKDVINTR